MKKANLPILFCTGIFLLIASCKKDQIQPPSNESINSVLKEFNSTIVNNYILPKGVTGLTVFSTSDLKNQLLKLTVPVNFDMPMRDNTETTALDLSTINRLDHAKNRIEDASGGPTTYKYSATFSGTYGTGTYTATVYYNADTKTGAITNAYIQTTINNSPGIGSYTQNPINNIYVAGGTVAFQVGGVYTMGINTSGVTIGVQYNYLFTGSFSTGPAGTGGTGFCNVKQGQFPRPVAP